jgi:hypothetical protein
VRRSLAIHGARRVEKNNPGILNKSQHESKHSEAT